MNWIIRAMGALAASGTYNGLNQIHKGEMQVHKSPLEKKREAKAKAAKKAAKKARKRNRR